MLSSFFMVIKRLLSSPFIVLWRWLAFLLSKSGISSLKVLWRSQVKSISSFLVKWRKGWINSLFVIWRRLSYILSKSHVTIVSDVICLLAKINACCFQLHFWIYQPLTKVNFKKELYCDICISRLVASNIIWINKENYGLSAKLMS